MEATVQTQVPRIAEPPEPAARGVACVHCGTPCAETAVLAGGRAFCCGGCRTVYELLTDNGLGHFYDLGPQAGIRAPAAAAGNPFAHLDDPLVRQGLLDYADAKCSRVTFRIPAIHCVACVWLLENLFRLKEGVGRSQVNFPRRELSVTFEHERLPLSELVALLHSLGYTPDLNLGSLERRSENAVPRRLWLRLGVAGFSFGNIMLFSLPSYLGLRAGEDGRLAVFFGLLSILLAVPVLAFAASDYFHAAWVTVRRRILTIDLPIAVGLVALFGQSVWEIGSGRGEGYLDSLTGLVFFLLIGKAFQHRTYERLVFDRDYKSFFPLSVWRRRSTGDEMVSISRLAVGDRLVLRHGELIPADGRLVEGVGLVDYSFVTGESAPVERQRGDTVYAGGVQQGGLIEVEILKPVSHSYLTSLWADEAFAKTRGESLDTLTNRFSRRFTASVVAIALGAAAYWAIVAPARAVTAFTSVLIVACPCALALAAPFALGTAQRLLGRRRIFLKNSHVIEALAKVDTVVFDKTGTLTAPGASAVQYQGGPLTGAETLAVRALLRASTHPYAARIVAWGPDTPVLPGVRDFEEVPGRGVAGEVTGRRFVVGSAAWLESRGIGVSAGDQPSRAAVQVAIDGRYRGRYELGSPLRPEAETLIRTLDAEYELALSSGDHGQDSERFRRLFGPRAAVHFHQSPMNKLGFVRELQGQGRTVAMVGDGLNDAGALRQSDVGVAVVERMGAFSPASDVILEAAAVGELTALLRLARASVQVVWLSFLLSSLYNVVGLSIAASGRLSPLICAILMPLSSLSVVLFATAATRRAARRCGLGEAAVGAPAGTGPREVAV